MVVRNVAQGGTNWDGTDQNLSSRHKLEVEVDFSISTGISFVHAQRRLRSFVFASGQAINRPQFSPPAIALAFFQVNRNLALN